MRKLPEIAQKKPLRVSYVHLAALWPAQKAGESEIFYANTRVLPVGAANKPLTADTPVSSVAPNRPQDR